MKKRLVLALLLLALGCTACDDAENIEANVEQEETENKENLSIENEDESDPEIDTEIEGEVVSVTVYYPDDMLEEVLTEVVECDELTAGTVWDLLKDKGILKEECMFNSLEQDGTSLELDVNEAFGTQLRSYGTAGEKMMLHCVVNTFLDAYDCETIKITENGAVLESGHVVYTDYLTKYE